MKPFDRLLFGTAGTPNCAKKKSTVEAMDDLASLGLDAMEIEYVRGTFPREDTARSIALSASNAGIRLTAHGPYYINLNADDEDKLIASRRRILTTAQIGALSGAESITFHAGFYMKQDQHAVERRIETELKMLVAAVDEMGGVEVDIRPEVTGKPTQVGSLDLLLSYAATTGVKPCIDWSHLHARTGGECNTASEFESVLTSISDSLGEEGLHDMHMHVSGIDYSAKGEKKHLNLDESDFNYHDLIRVLKANDVRGILICESPSIEDDARILKDVYGRL